MFLKTFVFAHSRFSSRASDRRGVVANLGVEDTFDGTNLTLSYCTNLMLCQRV